MKIISYDFLKNKRCILDGVSHFEVEEEEDNQNNKRLLLKERIKFYKREIKKLKKQLHGIMQTQKVNSKKI